MKTVPATTTGGFTGRHMLIVILAFFAVVVAVNITMAMIAGSSWTGFVVRNSYVASQEFNGRVAAARAQANLGWSASLAIEGGEASLRLMDGEGHAVPVRSATLALRSPASDRKDRVVALTRAADGFHARLDVDDGQWVVEIAAAMPDGGTWKDTRRIVMERGRAR